MTVATSIEKLRQLKPSASANGFQAKPGPAVPYTPNPEMVAEDAHTAPPFPLHIFPQRIQQVVLDCERYMSFPPDITAAGILAATALAIGRSHRLHYQAEWYETACIYMAIVAPPGSAKSHPLKFALDPIIQHNKKAIKDYARAQAQMVEQAMGQSAEPVTDGQCLFSDFTIEALIRSIQKNPRGIGVWLDELRALFQNFNRYNAGSEQEFWLQNWSGMSMAVTRMTKKAWLEWPSISIVGTIQPSMLDDIGKGGRSQNGFTERILFVYPDNVPVLKLKKRHERSDTRVILGKNYSPVIQEILAKPMASERTSDEDAQAHELGFEASADDYATDYLNDLKRRMEVIDNEYLRNVYSKMQTYYLRFCLILNRLDQACLSQTNTDLPPYDDLVITERQAGRAAELTEYFLLHALKANSVINTNSPITKLPKNELNFYRALPIGQVFSARDAEDIAVRYQISRAKLYRMFSESDPSKRLFQKISHGVWERIHV